MSNTTPEFLTPAEAAHRLRVSPITLRSWAEKGLIQVQVTAGGHRRYPLAEIERLLQRQRQPENSPLRIMVVDDDPFILALLQKFLSSQVTPVSIETANDGFEAGRKLASFKPDVLLLDLMMPKMDGFDVCRQIKNDPATAFIRVIAMSGNPDQENVERILSLGAETCLSKPIDTAELLTTLGLD